MKIVIDQPPGKVMLDGSFSLCASRGDLERVVGQLQAKLASDPAFTYGWVEVHEPLGDTRNTKPVSMAEVATLARPGDAHEYGKRRS